MPELPEVETIRRQLAPHLEGRRIASVEVLDPRWGEPAAPAELADALEGREVLAVKRRGKYFDVELSGSTPSRRSKYASRAASPSSASPVPKRRGSEKSSVAPSSSPIRTRTYGRSASSPGGT